MPIFLFKCKRCKDTVEKIQPVDSNPPLTCSSCGEHGTMEKQISAPSGFVLKENRYGNHDYYK